MRLKGRWKNWKNKIMTLRTNLRTKMILICRPCHKKGSTTTKQKDKKDRPKTSYNYLIVGQEKIKNLTRLPK